MDKVKAWWAKAKRIADFLRPMQIPLHSAYTSFFVILSMFPFLLLFLGMLRYTSLRIEDLMQVIEGFLPPSLIPMVSSLVEASYRHSSKTVVSISVVAAIYSASRGMFGIRNGLNAIWTQPGNTGYFRKRSLSILYTLAFLLLLVLTLAAYLLGSALLDFLTMTTAPGILLLTRLMDLRWLLLAVLQSLLFTLLYALLPARRLGLRQCLPGAIAASLGWSVYSRLFSVYVEHFSEYANIFGSIYGLALGMLWLYFCMAIFFWGGALNRYLWQRRNP